jgi:hypothetical protein
MLLLVYQLKGTSRKYVANPATFFLPSLLISDLPTCTYPVYLYLPGLPLSTGSNYTYHIRTSYTYPAYLYPPCLLVHIQPTYMYTYPAY